MTTNKNKKLKKQNNISVVWDFDGTLTGQDSTSEVIKMFIEKKDITDFWKGVKTISRVKGAHKRINSISTSESPAWMYKLAEFANKFKLSLDKECDRRFLLLCTKRIKLYRNALPFLQKVKVLSEKSIFKKNNIQIHHFIITAGLEDLITLFFESKGEENLIRKVFGCQYHSEVYEEVYGENRRRIENIPIYCMDKTTKTRSLFEINKGCFIPKLKRDVDTLIQPGKEWCPFENMIYIGDGETDIPAFSLVKSRKGMAIGVYKPKKKKNSKIAKIIKGKRIDLLTSADFSFTKKLYKAIEARCLYIADRYNSQNLN